MNPDILLRRFSKLVCLSTVFLIFVGGMVTSTGSGLAVPDWPLSYGTLFPPMIGGIFYEHGHRMVAAFVGLLTLCLAILLGLMEKRKWLRTLGFIALGTVILQGVLGGITVLFFLPTVVSVFHGILAQTFFILTIIIAYSLSYERSQFSFNQKTHTLFLKCSLIFICLIYAQLILGAIMRHTASGLAIPDFPKMGGQWIPAFDDTMMHFINDWRFDQNLDPVNKYQVGIHFVHRAFAFVIVIVVCILNYIGVKYYLSDKRIQNNLLYLNVFVLVQILLGILTVLTKKDSITTSIHVVNGAVILGLSVLLFMRASPLTMNDLKQQLL